MIRKYKLITTVILFCGILISVLILVIVKSIRIAHQKPSTIIEEEKIASNESFQDQNKFKDKHYNNYNLEFKQGYFDDCVGYFYGKYRLNFARIKQQFLARWISYYPEDAIYNMTYLSFNVVNQFGVFCDEVQIYFYTLDYQILQNWKVNLHN